MSEDAKLSVYYNEFDPHAAKWLENLGDAGLISPGSVDTRDIRDVRPDDVMGYRRCNWFAGITGWELALQLAGWPANRPVWTGSCPCPPFSAAGKKHRCPSCGRRRPIACPRRTGYFICISCEHAWFADERHLWPEFYRLIRDCRPPVVFGEQVSSTDGLIWFAGVRACLEKIGYAVGACDLAAASVGAPHARHRIFWVAYNKSGRSESKEGESGSGRRWESNWIDGKRKRVRFDFRPSDGDMVKLKPGEFWPGPCPDCGAKPGEFHGPKCPGPHGPSRPERMGDPMRSGREGHVESIGSKSRSGRNGKLPFKASTGSNFGSEFWSDYELIQCRDGKSRRTQSGLFPLAPRLSFVLADGCTIEGTSRVKLLKGIGNSIVPQVAAEFIMAFMEAELYMNNNNCTYALS